MSSYHGRGQTVGACPPIMGVVKRWGHVLGTVMHSWSVGCTDDLSTYSVLHAGTMMFLVGLSGVVDSSPRKGTPNQRIVQ